MIKNIPPVVAGELMGKSPQFIRIGLQRNLLPFGQAVKLNARQYTYYISPKRFVEYTGISEEIIEERIRGLGLEGRYLL